MQPAFRETLLTRLQAALKGKRRNHHDGTTFAAGRERIARIPALTDSAGTTREAMAD